MSPVDMYSEKSLKHFWAKVDIQPEGCWLWTGNLSHGYGRIQINGIVEPAHKVSLKIHLGRDIQLGMDVAHQPLLCHTRNCVNPLHLREATRSENCLDKGLDGTHPNNIGARHGRAKFTEAQVIAIRDDDRLHRIIAEEYGVARTTISALKRRDTWTHL